MLPAFIINSIISGVKVIKIYPPRFMDANTIKFLVSVDGCYCNLLLNDDGVWQEPTSKRVPADVFKVICEQIEARYCPN